MDKRTRTKAVVDDLHLLYGEGLDSDEFILFPDDDSHTQDKDQNKFYWRKRYGGRDAFECLVRTVLSQNTSDRASQPAHDALMERYSSEGASEPNGDPANEARRTSSDRGSDGERSDPRDGEDDLAAALADARQDELAETISSAGLQNRKAETLVRLAGQVRKEYGDAGAFDEFVAGGGPAAVREALLEMRGVGPKTADCVLLFAGGQAGVFPVKTKYSYIPTILNSAV